MREIKFQIILDNKVFGYERLTDKGWERMVIELNPDNGERWTPGVMANNIGIIRRQFTGRTTNGKQPIYNGDIVKVTGRKKVGEYITEVVESSYGGYKLSRNDTYVNDESSIICIQEVIGNIYSNPELLKTQTPTNK